MRHIRALDGVRAFAVLAVFAHHLTLPMSEGGWLGVDVFFVLSGYLITTLLLREHERTGGIALARFYTRRLLRLYPALLVVIAVGLLFAPVLGPEGTLRSYLAIAALAASYTTDLAILVTGRDNFGALTHTWSLAVEEQFYLLWPLALIAILRRRGNVMLWALSGALASLAALLFSLLTTTGQLAYYYPVTRAYELLLGCALATWLAQREHRPDGAGAKLAAAAGVGGLVALLAVVDDLGTARAMPVAIAIAGVLSCLLVGGLATGDGGPIDRVLCLRPIVALGRISYGVYLWHFPVLTVIHHYLHVPRPLEIGLDLVITIALAAASNRWVERPFIRMKDALANRPVPVRAGLNPAPTGPDDVDPHGEGQDQIVLRPRDRVAEAPGRQRRSLP